MTAARDALVAALATPVTVNIYTGQWSGNAEATVTHPGALADRLLTALTADETVERMARAMYAEGAWCGDCDFDGWDTCSACLGTVRGYARAALAALTGDAT